MPVLVGVWVQIDLGRLPLGRLNPEKVGKGEAKQASHQIGGELLDFRVQCIPSAKVGHIGPRVKRELEGLRG